MRLINTHTFELQEFFGGRIPNYAILSHRWENEEVTYQDLRDGKGPKMEGWKKVLGCCRQAALDGWEYAWIDTCCIDKSSSAELSETINSMFAWYRDAQVCYAYLSDVPRAEENPHNPDSCFRRSKWFTRGWTLQELLAPERLEFLDKNWRDIGTKLSLQELIKEITGITHLFDHRNASVAQKMSWASKRSTTRPEDVAYCLLGLFDVNMPLLYGEGGKAFLRLQTEILNWTDDDCIFAWKDDIDDLKIKDGQLLAFSPGVFLKSGDIVVRNFDFDRPPLTITGKGLGIELFLIETYGAGFSAPLNCGRSSETQSSSAIHPGQQRVLALEIYPSLKDGRKVWRRLGRLVSVHAPINLNERNRTRVFVPQLTRPSWGPFTNSTRPDITRLG